MRKPRIGAIACLVVLMLLLLGCSPYKYEATSVNRLRELIVQTEIVNPTNSLLADAASASPKNNQNPSIDPSTQATSIEVISTEATSHNQNVSTKNSEPYDRDYLGYVPDDYYGDLTAAEKRGLQTWYFWTGGNEKFFRDFAKQTHGENDFLSLLDARPDSALFPGDTHHIQRNERFNLIGAINDPSCKPATAPDEYGLWLDKCDKDPQAVGIMGARKFPNPSFDPQKWDVAKYYAVGEERAQIEPPYRIGMSCGVCHIAYNPLKPPADLENPKWGNLASAIGNQYLREGALFGGNLPPADFRRQVLDSQPPGTSDTSRIATDHINNPNAINAIFNLEDRLNLANQPGHAQVLNDGTTQGVPNVLKDGADSEGVALASERVYINIGSCSDYWLSLHDPLLGRKPQKPFDIATARKDCEYWSKTEARMADAEAFLKTLAPMHLEDAPGGKAYLTNDKAILERGKVVFADTCATCHSSKQPPADIATNPEQAKEWYRQSVLSSDFLDHNFLSDDLRKPVTLIGTNAGRALGTNAIKGHVWEQFSSKTYKELPSPGTLKLENPFDKNKPIEFKVTAGGTGYYRTPSLISLWSSAPLFHNNMLGKYNADPSVKGRMDAFNDAIEKLLWSEKREGTILRTDQNSVLAVGKLQATVPKGTPIDLLANLNPSNTPKILQRKLNSDVGAKVLQALVNFVPDNVITPLLLKYNEAPDFIEDRGHYFGTDLLDEDKRALIEFLKTF